MSRFRTILADLAAPPDLAHIEIGHGILWSGLLAGGGACGSILLIGLRNHVPSGTAIIYGLVSLLYLMLLLLPSLTHPLSLRIWQNLWAYLLVMAGLSTLLQMLSGEAFLQPIVFTVPIVHAALIYSLTRTMLICAGYLGLMNLAIGYNSASHLSDHLFATVGYTTLMALLVAFTRLSVEQLRARQRADRLAADLAQQRDYLAHLSQITATLTRDLDLTAVLEQVAANGRSFAQAAQARVWLYDDMPDAAGAPMRLAAAVPAQAPLGAAPPISAERALPLVYKGASIGMLELIDAPESAGAPIDRALLQPFADAAAIAIENARLYEQSHLSATLAERNRLARELHDTIAQGLTAVTMQLEAAQRSFERDPARARARLARAHVLARETLEDVRRSVWTLAAPLIDGSTLAAALSDLVGRFAERTAVAARYQHSGPAPELGHTAASQTLRIVQEALQNIEKHAQASAALVESQLSDGVLTVQVSDDGVGFDPLAPRPADSGGFGLLSLRERARLAGGSLQIESAPGLGTRLTLRIPSGRARAPEDVPAEAPAS